MAHQRTGDVTAKAVIVVLLGAAVFASLVLVDGSLRWLLAGLAMLAMIGFLVPVLRTMRDAPTD